MCYHGFAVRSPDTCTETLTAQLPTSAKQDPNLLTFHPSTPTLSPIFPLTGKAKFTTKKRSISMKTIAPIVLALSVSFTAAAEADKVEEALSEVQHVKADLHSRDSSVLGVLPGPAETAAHQMRCRPLIVPKAGAERDLDFAAEIKARGGKVNPAALGQVPGRFGLRVLPLGVTGAYVTEHQNRREMMVVHVVPKSPADGALQVHDVILGANGRLFVDPEDPRPEMGEALCESQSSELGGILTLHVVRDKQPVNAKVDLGSKLGYSPTWPYDCEKSKKIRQAALEYVMADYPWDRRDFWTPTFLMASGDDAALELARRHLCAKIQDNIPPGRGGQAWRQSYRLINLCEYYLLTGDSFVLPSIRYNAECLAWAQYRSGSWSHGGGGPNSPGPGTCDGGYGEINCAGLGAFVGLCLARQCGVEPYDHTLPRSIRFFGEFCGANFPYGLGSPSPRGGRMDNGMNSMAAIGFHLLGEDAMADRWARTVCYMWMGRERGHAEAIFSGTWGPVGAALAPKEEFHAFMNHMRWAYEMGRARDGSISFMRGGRWVHGNMTAAMGLFLYLPERRLQVLGGDSVFARPVPAGLEKAAQLYRDKEWTELESFLTKYLKAPKEYPQENVRYATDMLSAYERLEKHATATLGIVERNIADGRGQTAVVQLDLLAKMLGEERPAAAKLRKRIGEDPGKDRAVQKREPLVVIRDVIDELGLAGGGIDNGFAHSPAYIAQVNKQGFEGMQPREIAAFLAHPSGGVAEGATQALVEHGEAIVPLMMELVHDKHPGIGSGAMGVLSKMYQSDAEEYSETIPPEYKKVVAMIEPLTRHESDRIRKSATRMLLNMKILNEDMKQVLCEIAKLEGSRIDHCVRYGIKDPAFRTRLAMELINTANRAKSQVPTHYKPINWVVSAHIDQCEPYLQTAVDTLRNPSVLMLYGFFSQGPPNQSMRMLSHYADNPLVFENLPDILRYSARRREEFGHYWWPVYEYPHRIVLQIGPRARPVVEQFLKEEETLYKQILAGEVEKPVWWVEPSEKHVGMLEHSAVFADEMRTTCRLSETLAAEKPTKTELELMCEVYLADRRFGEWERQQIRDFWTDLGPLVVPLMRKAIEKKPGSRIEELEKEIAAVEAELAKKPHKHILARLETQLAGLTRHKDRYDELAQQADLLEALAAEEPTPDDVRTLCRFYVKRPWGSQHPHTRSESSYMRQFDAKQMQRIRDTLQRWGGDALPTLRAFLAEDKKTLAALMKQLDEDYAYWETQRARVRGLPMARTAREKEDVQDIRLELSQLADLIEAASMKKLSRQQAARLLELCTRRNWPTQNQLVVEILQDAPFDVSKLVEDHIAKEQAAMPTIQEEIDTAMPKTTSTGTRWRYERAVALRKSIHRGIISLETLFGEKT